MSEREKSQVVIKVVEPPADPFRDQGVVGRREDFEQANEKRDVRGLPRIEDVAREVYEDESLEGGTLYIVDLDSLKGDALATFSSWWHGGRK